VTDDDFKIWVMCHCVRADLDVTKSDHNWDTTLTQPRKDDHQKRDTDVWMIHSGVFHIEDHILLDWQRSTRALFMFCSLFSTFSSSLSSDAEAISSLLVLPVIPVTAEGRNFLTAPEAFAEEMRFFKPSTLLLKCLAWSSRLEEETF